ncbi:zinc finger protein 271-like [Copidosoma floridanum]|uniref:zinc finger protein 271-like n=1 Tax=Copidosoma floridanum TaxID=29053 RepID=UPI0006C979EB|nr:zinc finger protein 271-like [Copidosoma floridanum]
MSHTKNMSKVVKRGINGANKRRYHCVLCSHPYVRNNDIQKNVNPKYNYLCNTCLTAAVQMIKGKPKSNNNHRCTVCFYTFSRSCDLERHMSSKHTHLCTSCSLIFTTRADLTSHMNSQHIHSCTRCSKNFETIGDLTKHMDFQHMFGDFARNIRKRLFSKGF